MAVQLDKKYANQQVVDFYNKAVLQYPNNIDLIIHKANVLFYLGRKDEHNDCLKVVDGIFQKSGELYDKGLEEYNNKNNQKALDMFDQAIKINSKHKDAYYMKGMALHNLGMYKESSQAYEMGASVDFKAEFANKGYEIQTNVRNADTKIQIDQDSNAYAGNVFYYSGKYKFAIEKYNAVLNFNPENIFALYYKGNALKNLGLRESEAKARSFYQKALECFDSLLKLNPKHVEAIYNKGNTLKYAGKDQEAIACYDDVIKLDPSFASAYNNKALILRDLGNDKEALECYNAALKIDKYNVLYLCNRAQTYLNLGNKKLALEDLKEASLVDDMSKIQAGTSLSHARYTKEVLSNLVKLEEELNKIQTDVGKLNPNSNQTQLFVSKVDQLKRKKELLDQDTLENLGNQDQKIDYKALYEQQKNEFLELQKQIQLILMNQQKQNDEVYEIKKSINESGLTEELKVKIGFGKLYENNAELHEYAKVFYWTLLNYFSAYRNLGTGLFQGNINSVSTTKDKILVKAAKTGMKLVEKFFEHIPIVGGIIGVIDTVIDEIYDSYKEKKFEDRINAINKIIMFNNDQNAILEKDISLSIAKSALEIVNTNKENVLNPQIQKKGFFQKANDWINEKIHKVKEKAFGAGIELYESPQATKALSDVILLLAYMYKNTLQMVSVNQSLDKQIVDIVVSGKVNELLVEHNDNRDKYKNGINQQSGKSLELASDRKEQQQEKQSLNDKEQQQGCCNKCQIFYVIDHQYDDARMNAVRNAPPEIRATLMNILFTDDQDKIFSGLDVQYQDN